MTTEAKPAAPEAAPPAKKTSKIGGIFAVLLPTIFAAGAAYAGTRGAVIHAAAAPAAEKSESAAHKEAKPPGPTLPLEPFLLSVYDEHRKAHPMKMSLAVEFEADPKGGGGSEHGGGGELKEFMPRIRDAVLAYLRTLTYEEVTDAAQVEKMRTELVERCQKAGAAGAERILITDFVVQ